MNNFSLAKVFGDNMILQRDTDFCIWGFNGCDKVKVSIIGKTTIEKTCICDDNGNFTACFKKMSGGNESYIIKAKCQDEEITINNVRFGDVFLLLGQSNMSYTLSSVEKAEYYVEQAKNCNISALSLREQFNENNEVKRPVFPLDDLLYDYIYSTGSVGNIGEHSAIGVMTSVIVNRETNIPTGFVDTSMGGLSVESYLPYEYAEKDENLKKLLKKYDRFVDKEHYNKQGGRNFTQLYGVYNEKIAPISKLKFCSFIWYLGESSAYDLGLAKCFQKELEIIIREYRKIFGNIPFININIAPEYYFYGDSYGYIYINDAINRIERKVKNCFSIPIYKIEPRWLKENGDLFYHPIHPVNKEPVAQKIAQLYIENFIKNNKTAYPFVKKYIKNSDNGYTLEIGNCENGLKNLKNICGFAIKDKDGRYYKANGKIKDKDKIEIFSDCVKNPCGFSYGFMQYQKNCNVISQDGKELLPFCSTRKNIDDSFFPCPQFMDFSNLYVEENCFGPSVGTYKKYESWENGKIYGYTSNIKHIEDKNSGDFSLQFNGNPENKGFYFFGVSPKICLSGERNGLSCYPYLNFSIKSDKKIEFYGIVARMANGNIYRFPPLEMGEKTDFVNIEESKKTAIYIGLESAFCEDMSYISLSKNQRKNICEIEFLMRSKENCLISFENLRYVPEKSNLSYIEKSETIKRVDIVLPD